eukprot:c2708_g1_i1.p1 GENE.c2708_g1_i1~~c2708_g1_i1.p1  ORF type:complete len:199 (+),score=43.31 c2708_g1_i1:44-640(+)
MSAAKPVLVSVIGTSGSNNKFQPTLTLSLEVFKAMEQRTKEVLKANNLNPSDVCLVSGGAAWADHVAVSLFLGGGFRGLILHLPTNFEKAKCQYEDNGHSHWAKNPGKLTNQRHMTFSRAIGKISLQQIALAMDQGAIVKIHNGFREGDTAISKCDLLIAYSWAEGAAPGGGGTLDTWKKCTLPPAKKVYFSLDSLLY